MIIIKKQIIRMFLFLCCFGLLVACGGEEPTPTPEPTAAPTVASEPLADGDRRFVIDPAASTASYIVSEEFMAGALAKLGIEAGLQEVTGTTPEVNGALVLNLGDGQNELVAGEFTVDISALETARNQRDEWIRENALESNTYPLATFVATSVDGAPTSYTDGEEVTFQMNGDLTVREITQPVTFDVTATLAGNTINAVATTDMQLTDFGFDPPSFANTLTVANDFTIRVEIVANEEGSS